MPAILLRTDWNAVRAREAARTVSDADQVAAIAGDRGGLRRDELGCSGDAGRHGPADAAGLSASVQRPGAFGVDRPQGSRGRPAAGPAPEGRTRGVGRGRAGPREARGGALALHRSKDADPGPLRRRPPRAHDRQAVDRLAFSHVSAS